MGAEQHICWRMSCDRCREPLFLENFGHPETWKDFWTEDDLYREAEKQGWAIGDSFWYCPDCQKARQRNDTANGPI